MSKMVAKLIALVMAMLLVGCGGGEDAFGTPGAVTPPGTASTIASLQLSISPTTVKSDDSTTTTLTVTAINSANAAVPDVIIVISAVPEF